MTLFVNILYPFLKDKTLIDSKQHPFVFRMKETRACVWKNGRGHTLSMPPPHRCLPLALPCICSPSQPRLCNNSYSFVGTRGQLPVGASHVSISPRPVGVQTGGGWSHGDAQGRCCGRRCPPAWPPGVLWFPVARPSSAPSAGLHGNCLCLPVAFILETPFYSRGPSELKGIGGLWVLGSLRLGEREPEDAGTEGRELSPGSSPTWECPSVSSTARCQSRRCCLCHNHLVFRSQGASTIKQIATEGAQEITSKMMFHSTAQMGRQNNPMRMKSEYEN